MDPPSPERRPGSLAPGDTVTAMARYEHLPIYRQAFAVALHFEQVVAGFSRYHKYTLGAELRQASRAVVLAVTRANAAPNKAPHLLVLRGRLDELLLLLRLAKEAKAFRSFAAYTHAVEQVASVCRQNEGWLRSVTGSETSAGTGGQNPAAPGSRPARRERAKLNHRAPAPPGGPGHGDAGGPTR